MRSPATAADPFGRGIIHRGPRDSNPPRLLRALPVDGETWRRRGSMKGVKEEEDLCFCMLLLDWL